MNNDSVIYSITAACRESLEECVRANKHMKDEWAMMRLADFNLWAAGIGASAQHKASLDARLSLKPDVRDMVAKILQMLKSRVEVYEELTLPDACLTPATDANDVVNCYNNGDDEDAHCRSSSPSDSLQRAFSPWPDESSSESESELDNPPVSEPDSHLLESRRAIEAVLSQLSIIAVAIRHSGARSRLQKADRSFNAAQHRELEDHLKTIVLRRPGISIAELNNSEPSRVQQRLINCNLRRRHRFMYAQRHAEELQQVRPVPKLGGNGVNVSKTVDSGSEKSLNSQQSSSQAIVSPQPVQRSSGRSERTGTTASAVSESYPLPQDPNPTPSQVAPTQTRKHIADDVSPYTCILENCNKEHVLYASKEAWKAHLIDEHQNNEYWVCFPCGGDAHLPTKAAFVAHMREEHQHTILESQIELLVPVSKRSVPMDITTCPLCDAWPPKGPGEIDREELINHIAEEVHAFSLRALPWPPDDDEAGGQEQIGQSVKIVQDWLTNWNLTHPDAKENPPYPRQQKAPTSSNYFRSHPYFAENGCHDSTSGSDSNDSATENLILLRKEGPLIFTDAEDMNIAREAGGDVVFIQPQGKFGNS
ncbi:hypothetical protein N7489_003991 [Penicillium chrysogenum]|uniref:uncharacterized protein n=1 Tax=Penicillium chrysogenum TaxID=5076 RepID=UPI0024DF0A91|nr:uncharacterized protein N7489_003991 [Penicillium chrysogenum]KAJ5243895.1 hypothetical protein N7489_003991 [Penicillium chrysogenum]